MEKNSVNNEKLSRKKESFPQNNERAKNSATAKEKCLIKQPIQRKTAARKIEKRGKRTKNENIKID